MNQIHLIAFSNDKAAQTRNSNIVVVASVVIANTATAQTST